MSYLVTPCAQVYTTQTDLKVPTHRKSAKSVLLSCDDPAATEPAGAIVDWSLTPLDPEDAQQEDASSSGAPLGFCRGYALLDDDCCYDCLQIPNERRELRGENAKLPYLPSRSLPSRSLARSVGVQQGVLALDGLERDVCGL